jgi:hypothetical protein
MKFTGISHEADGRKRLRVHAIAYQVGWIATADESYDTCPTKQVATKQYLSEGHYVQDKRVIFTSPAPHYSYKIVKIYTKMYRLAWKN